eukprot:TRINITY_DN39716_c0_g1_i1.p1 TRINITY_DN39716_c0_g1~~TRINITY_DN39716_c0_g1_i1.p1  ORF type:complete len:497 (-),score=99.18 TRINITY_DN39716_c0_g1_i1:289-1779(-)
MVQYYSASQSALRAVCQWSGTVTQDILTHSEIYVYLVTAAVFLELFNYNVISLPDGLLAVDLSSLVAPCVSLATFSLVFYVGQCYNRYYQIYNSCCDIDTWTQTVVNELVTDFAFDINLRPLYIAVVKYLLASIFYFYTKLNGDHGVGIEQWAVFRTKGLLTQTEVEFAKVWPGDTSSLFLQWALEATQVLVRAESVKERYTPPERAAITNRLNTKLANTGSSIRCVCNILNLPVPFPYFHLLNLLLMFSLMMSAWSAIHLSCKATEDTFSIALLPFFLTCFALLALRRIGGDMAEPFGEDVIDFPSHDFMRHVYDHSVTALLAPLRYDILADVRDTPEFTAKNMEHPCTIHGEGDWAQEQKIALKKVARWEDAVAFSEQCHLGRRWITPEDMQRGLLAASWLKQETMTFEPLCEEAEMLLAENDQAGEQDVTKRAIIPQNDTSMEEQMLTTLASMGSTLKDLVSVVEGKPVRSTEVSSKKLTIHGKKKVKASIRS